MIQQPLIFPPAQFPVEISTAGMKFLLVAGSLAVGFLLGVLVAFFLAKI